jgi:hypothetical protein
MAKFAIVRDLKNQTTALIREAEKGNAVVVTRRGKPVASSNVMSDGMSRLMNGIRPVSTIASRKVFWLSIPSSNRRARRLPDEDSNGLARKLGDPFHLKLGRKWIGSLKGIALVCVDRVR